MRAQPKRTRAAGRTTAGSGTKENMGSLEMTIGGRAPADITETTRMAATTRTAATTTGPGTDITAGTESFPLGCGSSCAGDAEWTAATEGKETQGIKVTAARLEFRDLRGLLGTRDQRDPWDPSAKW